MILYCCGGKAETPLEECHIDLFLFFSLLTRRVLVKLFFVNSENDYGNKIKERKKKELIMEILLSLQFVAAPLRHAEPVFGCCCTMGGPRM